MKKKYIDVNGKRYAWDICKGLHEYTSERSTNIYFIRVWENNKIIYEVPYPYHLKVTSKIVNKIIKAPDAIARQVIVAQPCPFCQGKVTTHPNPEWREDYYACYHEEDCYLNEGEAPMNFSMIVARKINQWNLRYESKL